MFEKEAEERAERKISNFIPQQWGVSLIRTEQTYETVEGAPHFYLRSLAKMWKDGAEFGYNKALKEIWHYPSKGEYPEKGKEILLYTKTLGLIFGEFCKGYKNLWTSNRCDFTTEEIIAWIEKEKILPKGD